MVWPAVIAAGASLAGGLISAKGALRSQEMSQAFTPEMMKLQNDYNRAAMERQYSLNQAQYGYELTKGPGLEMAGLRAAGINPMLRYGQGGSGTPMFTGGSSALSVGSPTMQFPNAFGDLGSGVAGAVSSALDARRSVAETERTQTETSRVAAETLLRLPAEVRQLEANTRLTEAQRQSELERPALMIQQRVLAEAQARLPDAQLEVFRATVGELGTRAIVNMWNAELLEAQRATEHARADLTSAQAGIARDERARSDIVTQQDLQLLQDATVGFILRTMRLFSGAAQGR